MRVLMLYADQFAYKTSVKGLEGTEEVHEEKSIQKALVGFIHVEPQDEENLNAKETRLIKNLKWAARKNETNVIVLHSFAHLSEAKANPEATKKLFDNAQQRLQKSGYQAYQTPFGYFLDIDLKLRGIRSQGCIKNFKERVKG